MCFGMHGGRTKLLAAYEHNSTYMRMKGQQGNDTETTIAGAREGS